MGRDRHVVRRHPKEIETLDEPLEDAKLPAQFGTATAGSVWRERHRGAVLVFGCERKVQVIVNPSAGQDESPGIGSSR